MIVRLNHVLPAVSIGTITMADFAALLPVTRKLVADRKPDLLVNIWDELSTFFSGELSYEQRASKNSTVSMPAARLSKRLQFIFR